MHSTQVFLQRYPVGALAAGDFGVRAVPLPEPGAGEALTETLLLSLDPYMRKRIADGADGRGGLRPGETMMGRTIGRVLQSRSPALAPGDLVLGWAGWQSHAVEPESRLQKIDAKTDDAELPLQLGCLGRPGITAWLGMCHIGRVMQGDSVVVSSAAGAVGLVAGQLARRAGARVTGVAGGPQKCRWLVEQQGFDHAVDHRDPQFRECLAAAAPAGFDLCFESVGGAVLDASLGLMKPGGRIALCGLLAHYSAPQPPALANFARLLDRGLSLRGFRIDDFADIHPQAVQALHTAWKDGDLRETHCLSEGLEQSPQAFVRMLAGEGWGKHLVRVAPHAAAAQTR